MIWVGTANHDDAKKSITLDLKGKSIIKNNTSGDGTIFVLTHGDLAVINTGAEESLVKLSGTANDATQVFAVYGSYRSSRWDSDGLNLSGNAVNTRAENGGWFSHLTIGDNVKIYADNGCQGTGIAINNVAYNTKYKTTATPSEIALTYGSTIGIDGNGTYGYAFGVRIDLEGDIDIKGVAGNNSKTYGIKVNGTIRYPKNAKVTSTLLKKFGTNDIAYLANYESHNVEQGENVATHKDDTIDAPYIHVHDGAKIVTRESGKKSTAIYASGYAKWLIEGECEGKTGLYASSGVVDLNDAIIKATAETYTTPGPEGSANGGGSGMVVNSRDNYAGGMDITISGETKVIGSGGYAIEEIVNTKEVDNPAHESDPTQPATIQETKVSNITIEGGTFEGGTNPTTHEEQPAIVVSGITANNETSEVVVYGGNIVDFKVEGDENKTLNDFIPSTVHTTEITVDGKKVTVVSEGAAPIASNKVSDQASGASVKWAGPDHVTDAISAGATLVLAELEINDTITKTESSTLKGQPREQTLTIEEGATLKVGRVVLGPKAQIIVEPGAKLIVNGEQGIVAPVVDNIVLQASATDQAVFLFNPGVTSNRHPSATVTMKTKDIGYLMVNEAKEYFWHRFALPIQEVTSWTKTPNVGAYVYGWNYVNNAWENYTALTQMKPFIGTTLTVDNDGLIEVDFTFKGSLAGGNDNNDLKFERDGFHFFGNSYTGHISIANLVAQLMADTKIDGSIWVWNTENQGYVAVPLMNQTLLAQYPEIAPMQTFILKQNVTGTNTTELNYESAVWSNPRYASFTGKAAPRRHEADETTRMRIVVSAENGKGDFVMFTEDGMFSDGYENGYDATKFMNENAINMYSTLEGENYSVVATDNIDGKMLTIQTNNGVNYTLSFDNVNGEAYAIRDNVTNQVIAIEDGATYEFAAQPNSVVEGRFEIVVRQNMPTAIENTEVKANVKGIYTVMGQYVGEDFEILPAGIYVVNGVKIVK